MYVQCKYMRYLSKETVHGDPSVTFMFFLFRSNPTFTIRVFACIPIWGFKDMIWKELYTSIPTLVQKLVLTLLNNEFILKIRN